MKHNKINCEFWLFDTMKTLNGSVWDYNILKCFMLNSYFGISFHAESLAGCNRRKITREWNGKYKQMFFKVMDGYNGSTPLYHLNQEGYEYVDALINGRVLKVDGKVSAVAVVNKDHRYLCDMNDDGIVFNLSLLNRLYKSTIKSISTVAYIVDSNRAGCRSATIPLFSSLLHYGTNLPKNNCNPLDNTGGFGDLKIKTWIEYNVVSCSFKRVFNSKDGLLGGRLYNTITNMSKKERLTMKLNGKDTVELDFSSMMPRMLYHKKGIDYEGDLYDVGNGFNRDHVKKAIVILINCKQDSKPEAVLQYNTDLKMSECKHLMNRIKTVHNKISEYFQSGIGLELQRIESDIVQSVMIECLAKKVEVTSIHDAVITTEENKDQVLECMIRYYQFFVDTEFKPVIKLS